MTSDYIVGLIDGEGSFTVYVRNPNDETPRKRRVKVEPRFYVKLVAKDKIVLDDLKKFFGCGNVYFQSDKRENHQDCYRFEVAKRSDLMDKIIPFFRKHKLKFPSKRKDFDIFCKIVSEISKKKHLTQKDLAYLYNLKSEMH